MIRDFLDRKMDLVSSTFNPFWKYAFKYTKQIF